jgi:hypothetical protein
MVVFSKDRAFFIAEPCIAKNQLNSDRLKNNYLTDPQSFFQLCCDKKGLWLTLPATI